MKYLYACFFVFICHFSKAQIFQQNGWEISGYVETYYSYDFNQPDDHLRPDFLFNFKRHNEFSVNLAFLRAKYEEDNIRGNLALMTGTYGQFNLADEPTWAQMVYEASVGVKLYDRLWLDVGVMPSHIGFESAEGMDNWHLSRSLLAENSPYFLTGGRLTYALRNDFDVVLWAANGWQNVQRVNRNQAIALGLGLNYHPHENLEINYANFFGNEHPQMLRLNRFFNNFYAIYSFGGWGVTVGGDYGIEDAIFSQFNQWFAFTASLRRRLGERFHLAGRADYYSDPKGVILQTGREVTGYSLNLDYQINERAMARIEWRQFNSPDLFDLWGGRFSKGNTAINSSLAIRF